MSRNTIRKYLANNIVEPGYPDRRRPSKLDDYAVKLTAWLKVEVSKGRKQKRSLKQLYRDLVQLGYTGSYDCEFRFKLDTHSTANWTVGA